MNSVSHFEIPADDMQRAQKFYSYVFGWTMGEDFGTATMVNTTETDSNGLPKAPGAINGDIFKREAVLDRPLIVITVASIDECVERIKQFGGVLAVEKTSVADMGWCAYFKDSEGNLIGLWENKL